MTEYLKGNYSLPPSKAVPTPAPVAGDAGQQEFEAQALQKLGGSIAFIKKSSSFVWTGKKDDARHPAR